MNNEYLQIALAVILCANILITAVMAATVFIDFVKILKK